VLDGERAIAIKGSHVQGSHVPKAAQGTNSEKCSPLYWFYTVDMYYGADLPDALNAKNKKGCTRVPSAQQQQWVMADDDQLHLQQEQQHMYNQQMLEHCQQAQQAQQQQRVLHEGKDHVTIIKKNYVRNPTVD
jgi:hypothetical protein